MSSTNKTTHYELSQYVGTDKPTYLSDYNGDMLNIDTAIHDAATDASTAVTTANSAASAATAASTAASTAVTTANAAETTANNAALTANTASTNAGAALTAAQAAQTAAAANTITNLAPAYDPTQTYDVDDLVTYIDDQGSGKLYKCIIAVTSPEAFNINKWDDVTTSEVYDRKYKSLVKTFNTTDDYATQLTGFFNDFKSLITRDSYFVFHAHDGEENFYKVDSITANRIDLSCVQTFINEILFRGFQIDSTTSHRFYTGLANDGTVSFHDQDNIIPAYDDISLTMFYK